MGKRLASALILSNKTYKNTYSAWSKIVKVYKSNFVRWVR